MLKAADVMISYEENWVGFVYSDYPGVPWQMSWWQWGGRYAAGLADWRIERRRSDFT